MRAPAGIVSGATTAGGMAHARESSNALPAMPKPPTQKTAGSTRGGRPGRRMAWSAGRERRSYETARRTERRLAVPSTAALSPCRRSGLGACRRQLHATSRLVRNGPQRRAPGHTCNGRASTRAAEPDGRFLTHLHAGTALARLADSRKQGLAAARYSPAPCDRSSLPPAASGSRPRGSDQSYSGTSMERTAKWQDARSWRRRAAGRGGRLPSEQGRVARSAMPIGGCSVRTRRDRGVARKGACTAITASLAERERRRLAFGVEDGEAGVIRSAADAPIDSVARGVSSSAGRYVSRIGATLLRSVPPARRPGVHLGR